CARSEVLTERPFPPPSSSVAEPAFAVLAVRPSASGPAPESSVVNLNLLQPKLRRVMGRAGQIYGTLTANIAAEQLAAG
ncbi:unnamed protein product, partial [Mycena citricolor]